MHKINLIFLGNMETSVEQKHWEHIWALKEDSWTFQRSSSSSGMWATWISWVWTTPGDGMGIRYIFHNALLDWCFAVIVIEEPESSYQVMIGIPRMEPRSCLAETRARRNSTYKGGGKEKDQGPVRERWMGIP